MHTFKVVSISLLVTLVIMLIIAIPLAMKFTNSNTRNSEESSAASSSSEPDTIQGLEIVGRGLTPVESLKPKERYKLPSFQAELEEAVKVNFETQAWLNVPNTNISYPVPINTSRMSGDTLNNEWYLTRALDGSYAGNFDERSVVFADSRNSLKSKDKLSQNTILYGHNWTNVESSGGTLKVADDKDKMFAQLPSFADIDFAKKTQYFTLDIDGEQLVFMVFSAMYVDTYNPGHKTGYYYLGTDQSDSEFGIMLEEARQRSEHLYRVPVNTSDRIVTLSTCTLKFGSNPNQRFVVMGRLLRDDEDIVDFPEPISNPMPKRPNI